MCHIEKISLEEYLWNHEDEILDGTMCPKCAHRYQQHETICAECFEPREVVEETLIEMI